jgi:CheY-like chemotaxis protein
MISDESSSESHRNLRILVVDDVAVNRKILKASLDKLSKLYEGVTISTVECDSGDSAIDIVQDSLFKNIHYDCMIIDYFMPGKNNGLEAAQAIHAADPKIAIIGFSDKYFELSAEIHQGLSHESLDCFNDFLGKKFKINDLYKILNEQFDLSSHRNTATLSEESSGDSERSSAKPSDSKVKL